MILAMWLDGKNAEEIARAISIPESRVFHLLNIALNDYAAAKFAKGEQPNLPGL